MTFKILCDTLMHMRLHVSDRVHLPFRQSAGWPAGTVIYADASRFRVAWDSHGRKRDEPRVRTWHTAADAARFRLGNPDERQD